MLSGPRNRDPDVSCACCCAWQYKDAAAGAVALLGQLSIFFLLLSALLSAAGARLPSGVVVAIALAPLVAIAALALHAATAPWRARMRVVRAREEREAAEPGGDAAAAPTLRHEVL